MMAELVKNVALVTGATGFIGRHLAQRLVDVGWSVKTLVREPGRLSPGLRGRVDVVVGDLADEDALSQAVQGVSVIFHCAANVHTWDSRNAYDAANVLGVKNLLNAVARHNPALARLVHVSTMDVYGFPTTPCDEQCATKAGGFGYSDTKLLGESLVREFCRGTGIPYAVIRPGNVIGPGSQFITRIGDELKSGLMLTVDGGRANAGLVYIDNLIDYILWAARSEKAIGQCYNVRDAYDVTWGEFIHGFRRAINGKGIILNVPYWAAEMAARVCEVIWRIAMPAREPLLHRLLVRIFGRTCGHRAVKIRQDSALQEQVGFDEAMNKSIRWFLEELHLNK